MLNESTTPKRVAALCACGCGKTAPIARRTDRRKGWIAGEAKRFVSGHNARGRGRVSYEESDCGYLTPCWRWLLSLDPKGYGRAQRNGKRIAAHRLLYEHYVGPIPDGLQLDHLCRNRACVNPDHLEVVANAENSRRSSNTRLTADTARAIRVAAGTHASIASEFSVSRQHVGDIKAGRRWMVALGEEQRQGVSVDG